MRQYVISSVLTICTLLPMAVYANHNHNHEPSSHQYSNESSSKATLTITHSSDSVKHTYSNTSSGSNSSSSSISSSHHHSHNSHHHSDSLDWLFVHLFLDIFDDSLFYGGIASMERVDGTDNGGLGLRPRVEGELLLPFFKFDASAVSGVAQGEFGSDLSFEMGYGPWGLHYRDTQFFEQTTGEINGYKKFDFLYRMSYGSEFEIDLGLGSYQVNGQPQFAFSLPMKLAFTPFNAVEFRPTWSAGVSDYDFAFYGGTEFYSFKVGYRYIVQSDVYSYSPEPIRAYSNVYAGFSAHY